MSASISKIDKIVIDNTLGDLTLQAVFENNSLKNAYLKKGQEVTTYIHLSLSDIETLFMLVQEFKEELLKFKLK